MPPQFKAISARRFKSQKAVTVKSTVAPTGTALRDYLRIPVTRLISNPALPGQLRLFRLEFVLVITSLPPMRPVPPAASNLI
jgi:hypothetical protein